MVRYRALPRARSSRKILGNLLRPWLAGMTLQPVSYFLVVLAGCNASEKSIPRTGRRSLLDDLDISGEICMV